MVLGLAWAILLAAEFLASQDGIGHILILAQQYAYTDRMILIVLLIMLYTFCSTVPFPRSPVGSPAGRRGSARRARSTITEVKGGVPTHMSERRIGAATADQYQWKE